MTPFGHVRLAEQPSSQSQTFGQPHVVCIMGKIRNNVVLKSYSYIIVNGFFFGFVFFYRRLKVFILCNVKYRHIVKSLLFTRGGEKM